MNKFLKAILVIAAITQVQCVEADGPKILHLGKNKSLQEMTQDVQESIKNYQNIATNPWDYQIATKDLAVQTGSLIKLVMQLNNERDSHGKSKDDLKQAISDELADILSLVLYVAGELNIDMTIAWENMLKSDAAKLEKRVNG